jgi:hypothetical protein
MIINNERNLELKQLRLAGHVDRNQNCIEETSRESAWNAGIWKSRMKRGDDINLLKVSGNCMYHML